MESQIRQQDAVAVGVVIDVDADFSAINSTNFV